MFVCVCVCKCTYVLFKKLIWSWLLIVEEEEEQQNGLLHAHELYNMFIDFYIYIIFEHICAHQ